LLFDLNRTLVDNVQHKFEWKRKSKAKKKKNQTRNEKKTKNGEKKQQSLHNQIKKKRYAKFPSIWDKATYFLFGGQEPQV